MSDEYWCDAQRGCGAEMAWLIDLGTYEGASGSPVFLAPIQFEIDGKGNASTSVGQIALVGVVKAILNSTSDTNQQLRALTPVEPVHHLQELFEIIFVEMRKAGRQPRVKSPGPGILQLP